MSATPNSSTASDATIKDIFLWKKKKQSLILLSLTTATWVLLEIYRFNFVTLISWVSIFISSSLFLLGNLLKLLSKEPPNLSRLEIKEQSAIEMANSVRGWVEEVIRWMFRVSAEREWFVFAENVAGLFLLSLLGSYFNLLTLIFTGVVLGMTVPVLYMKYENHVKRSKEKVKEQSRRLYDMVDEKVIKKMQNGVVPKTTENKEEKVE